MLSNFIFFSKTILAVLSFFSFQINFKTSLLISQKILTRFLLHWIYRSICENWHFKYLGSFKPWTQYIFLFTYVLIDEFHESFVVFSIEILLIFKIFLPKYFIFFGDILMVLFYFLLFLLFISNHSLLIYKIPTKTFVYPLCIMHPC